MMNYSTYNFFFTFLTMIPVLLWLAVSLWVVLDAEKTPAEAWTLSGESRNVWIAISLLLVWPFGLFFYLLIVRKKISTLAHSINEDALVTKAANRIRKEQATHDSYRPASSDESDEAYTDYDASDENDQVSYRSKKLRGVMTSAEAVRTSHGYPVDGNASEDNVFNYEESRESDSHYDADHNIPPRPDHEPTIGSDYLKNKEDEETKTTAYPVIPPKPDRNPSVGSERTED